MTRLWIAVRLGWRNAGRNLRRSMITASGVGVAFASLIALIGLMEGLKNQLLINGTSLELGHVQIHDGHYLPHRTIHDTIRTNGNRSIEGYLDTLEADERIHAASPRVHGYALLSSGEHSAGARLIGVLPERESRVTNMLQRAILGIPLPPAPSRSLILGRGLARELRVTVGEEVALVTQAADGSLGNDLFHVASILETGLAHLDRTLAVTHLRDLQNLLALEGERVHEIAVRLEDAFAADSLTEELNASGNLPPEALASSWGDLSPQLRDYMDLTEGVNGFMISLVALFAAAGLLNTMMMSVFERTREIGMLGSLGLQPTWILVAFLVEAFFLTVLGLSGGLAAGAILMSQFTTRGWDLSRWVGDLAMINTHMDPVLKGAWAWQDVGWAAIGLSIAALLAAFFPARRVAWMQPVQALRAPTEG